jgi:membrane protein implicated in regulation of membrane protease activity
LCKLRPVGLLYLAALIVGASVLALQFILPGGDGHDADHGPAHSGHDGAEHGTGFITILISFRFWIYGLLAFGLVGSLLHYLELGSPTLRVVLALLTGISCGLLATFVLSALQRSETSSGVQHTDVVGQIGRVLVPCSKGTRGKIRVEIAGTTLDLLALTDGPELERGAQVLIEELEGTTAHVSRASDSLLPGKL